MGDLLSLKIDESFPVYYTILFLLRQPPQKYFSEKVLEKI